MFTHIVFFRVKEPKDKISKELKEKLETLPAKIPQIKKFTVGIDVFKSPRSCDVCLYSEFDSKEDYFIYKDHPEHLKIIEYVNTVKTETFSADF